MAKNDPKNRKFFEKKFLVEIDLEWFKTCFKTKISILKVCPIKIFFRDIAVFFEKLVTKKSKLFRKKIFGRNRFRMVQNVFSNENINFENFFPLKNFFGDIAVFSTNWWNLGKALEFAAPRIKGALRMPTFLVLKKFFAWNRFGMVQNVF